MILKRNISLCLENVYQNPHLNNPDSRRFDKRIKINPGKDPGPHFTLSLTVHNKTRASPLHEMDGVSCLSTWFCFEKGFITGRLYSKIMQFSDYKRHQPEIP